MTTFFIDAYYYLHYGNEGVLASDMPGIKGLPQSFYSLDHEMTTGREPNTVIRLDSLSKFIAPGMRLGWIAGPQEFVTKYVMFQEMTSQV